MITPISSVYRILTRIMPPFPKFFTFKKWGGAYYVCYYACYKLLKILGLKNVGVFLRVGALYAWEYGTCFHAFIWQSSSSLHNILLASLSVYLMDFPTLRRCFVALLPTRHQYMCMNHNSLDCPSAWLASRGACWASRGGSIPTCTSSSSAWRPASWTSSESMASTGVRRPPAASCRY